MWYIIYSVIRFFVSLLYSHPFSFFVDLLYVLPFSYTSAYCFLSYTRPWRDRCNFSATHMCFTYHFGVISMILKLFLHWRHSCGIFFKFAYRQPAFGFIRSSHLGSCQKTQFEVWGVWSSPNGPMFSFQDDLLLDFQLFKTTGH